MPLHKTPVFLRQRKEGDQDRFRNTAHNSFRVFVSRHVNQRAKLRRAKNNSSRWNDGVFVIILWNGNHQIARLFTLGYLGTTYVASRNTPTRNALDSIPSLRRGNCKVIGSIG